MKIVGIGDPHINIGTWDPFTQRQSKTRRAALSVFLEAMKLCKDVEASGFVHTGDFVHGPARSPNLTPPELEWVQRNLTTCPLPAPIGNHDRPKGAPYAATSWTNICRPFPSSLRNTILRIHYQWSQEDLDRQFHRCIEKWKPTHCPRLLLIHAFPEGKGFGSEAVFRSEWIQKLRSTFSNLTILFGHDHVPAELSDKISILGSPVHLDFGLDPRPERRFFIWDTDSGVLQFIPVQTQLKHQRIDRLTSVNDLLELDRVEVTIAAKTVKEHAEALALVAQLRERGIEVSAQVTFASALEDVQLIQKTRENILSAYDEFAQNTPEIVKSEARKRLEQAGAK